MLAARWYKARKPQSTGTETSESREAITIATGEYHFSPLTPGDCGTGEVVCLEFMIAEW